MPEETGRIISKGRGKTRDMHNHRPSIRSNQGSERELHFITTPDVDRLLWKSECGANGPAFPAPAGTVVLLQPLHVRTFYVLFSH